MVFLRRFLGILGFNSGFGGFFGLFGLLGFQVFVVSSASPEVALSPKGAAFRVQWAVLSPF